MRIGPPEHLQGSHGPTPGGALEDSIGQEIAVLEKDGVLNPLLPITSVPTGHKVVGTTWVLKIKADDTYKVWLVVQGFLQIPGVCTFIPVCRLQSARIMLAIAVELDYEVHMLDVQTALLNANVEEDVIVTMAPGCETKDGAGVPFAMKLKKSLYGLR